jgi:hypothetical protein
LLQGWFPCKLQSWVLLQTRYAPWMMSKQTGKLSIAANLPFSDYFHANCKTAYCCKVPVYHAPRMDFHAKCKFEVLLLGRSQHVLDEDCRCSSSGFAKLGYRNDPPQHHSWTCLRQHKSSTETHRERGGERGGGNKWGCLNLLIVVLEKW